MRFAVQSSQYQQAPWASPWLYSVSSLSLQYLCLCCVATQLWVEFLAVLWNINYLRQCFLCSYGWCILYYPRLKLIATSKAFRLANFYVMNCFRNNRCFCNQILLYWSRAVKPVVIMHRWFEIFDTVDFWTATLLRTQILNWLLLHALTIRNCKGIGLPGTSFYCDGVLVRTGVWMSGGEKRVDGNEHFKLDSETGLWNWNPASLQYEHSCVENNWCSLNVLGILLNVEGCF